MTTTASKHGLRKAAGERRNKHSQKTPLPPKKVAAEVVEERAEERKAALAVTPVTTGSKSSGKAMPFCAEVESHGWTAKLTEGKGDHIEVLATRGNESIHIEWMNGVYQNTATYTIADRVVKLRNASAAKQYAARTPEQGQEELNRVASNRFFRRRETPDEELQRRPLPFDIEEATDKEIMERLAGRRVTWHNRFREESETGVAPKDASRIYITLGPDARRVVNFNCSIGGARSFRLDALLAVSGRDSAVTVRKTQDAKRTAAKATAR